MEKTVSNFLNSAETLCPSSNVSTAEASVGMLKRDHTSPDGLQEGEPGRNLPGKYLASASPVTPVRLGCCLLLLAVLTAAVVGLSVALAVRTEQVIESPMSNCPRNWIGFESKCFYFSDDTRNWTFSQIFCESLGAQLAQFESQEELNILRRYKGASDHWIGLHRESSGQPWKWTDNTEYNNLVSIRGAGEHAYLNDNGISSARVYAYRKWVCSRPNSYILQCQIPSTSSQRVHKQL